jgi:hypothetical protein
MIEDDLVEVVFDSVADFLRPGISSVVVINSLRNSLQTVNDSLQGSASREAEFGLQLLYLLGFSRSRELRFRAAVLLAVIGRSDKNLSEIAREHGFSRAAASKATLKILHTVPNYRIRFFNARHSK